MITSSSNPKLKLIHRLLESRRQREREGLFVAEGEDLVQAADDAGVDPLEVFRAGEDVEPELLAKISTMGHPPRVMALFRRDSLPRGVEPVSLALWRVGDPGNLGTILRTADAFGASVALSAGCADPTGPKALRASAGAVFRVPLAEFDEPSASESPWSRTADSRSRASIPASLSRTSSAPSARACRTTSSRPATRLRRSRWPKARSR